MFSINLGLVTPENRAKDSDPAEDNIPYNILSYANGPGVKLFPHTAILNLVDT